MNYSLLKPATLHLTDAIVLAMLAAETGSPRMEMLNRLAARLSRDDKDYLIRSLAAMY